MGTAQTAGRPIFRVLLAGALVIGLGFGTDATLPRNSSRQANALSAYPTLSISRLAQVPPGSPVAVRGTVASPPADQGAGTPAGRILLRDAGPTPATCAVEPAPGKDRLARDLAAARPGAVVTAVGVALADGGRRVVQADRVLPGSLETTIEQLRARSRRWQMLAILIITTGGVLVSVAARRALLRFPD